MTTPQNTKHLASGSTCPPLQNDLLRIYSMFFCPYAQRTRMVLNVKKVKHETVNIHLDDKPDWFLKINPLGKVPTLQLNDKIMYESMVTSDYLDETYPNPPLYPSDPWAKGVDRDLIEVFETKVTRFFYQLIMGSQEAERIEPIIKLFNDGLNFFEAELQNRGTQFFFGARPGMLDYAIFPWFERVEIRKPFYADYDIFSIDNFPKLTEYYEGMLKDNATKSTVANFDDHMIYLKSKLEGKKTFYDAGINDDIVLLSSDI